MHLPTEEHVQHGKGNKKVFLKNMRAACDLLCVLFHEAYTVNTQIKAPPTVFPDSKCTIGNPLLPGLYIGTNALIAHYMFDSYYKYVYVPVKRKALALEDGSSDIINANKPRSIKKPK